MDNSTQVLEKGKKVWWSDPDDDRSSGAYEVVEIKRDEDEGLYDDTIILISNGKSEAEVEAWELQDLFIRQEHIGKLINQITEIAEEDGWGVHNYCEDCSEIELEFSKYSTAGQDFSFCISTKSGAIQGFIDEVEDYIDGYDPDYEATLWTDEWGHGKNGAPYRLSDIITDMEECKNNMKALLNVLKQRLNDKSNGTKKETKNT